MPESGGRRAAAVLAIACGLVAFAVQLRHVWPFTADDAYITFRYAANWVAGHGPNFNAGGPRAEGFTSAGFLVVCAFLEALGADPVPATKAIGVACALGVGWAVFDWARKLGGTELAGGFAAFLWLGFHATAVHAASGMETLVAALLLTSLLRCPAGSAAFGPLALLCGLFRPELNVAAAVIVASSLRGPSARSALRSALLGWALPGAIYLAARWAYYGHPLPIPFYAKIAAGPIFPGWASTLAFVQAMAGIAALPAAVAVIAHGRRLVLPLATAAVVTALALLPDPVMDFDHRYAMPAVPALFVVAGLGLERIASRVAERREAVVALAAIVFFTARGIDPAVLSLRDRRSYGLALAEMNVRLGRNLAGFRPTDGHAPTLAIGDAGAAPYYSRWRTIDTFSLNDPAIAIDGRHDPAYVLDQRPDLVAVVSTQPREFRAHWANRHDPALFAAARARGMRPAVILTFSAASYLYVLAEPDSEIERYLRRIYLGRGG